MTENYPIEYNDFSINYSSVIAEENISKTEEKNVEKDLNVKNRKKYYLYIVELIGFQGKACRIFKNNKHLIFTIIKFILLCGYFVYFGLALHHEFGSEPSIRLLWITCTIIFILICKIIYKNFWNVIYGKVLKPFHLFINKHFNYFKWSFIFLAVVGILGYIISTVAIKHPENMRSLSGYAVYIILFFIFSHNTSMVQWRPVIWGLGIQFIFALLILRTSFGFSAFDWLGDRISEFLLYSDEGAQFVFGLKFKEHPFAFKILPTIIFFGSIVSVLYHFGIMQIIILKISFVIQKPLGTSPVESINATANIFIGLSEAPILIKPFLIKISNSELHAIMVSGFASISGSIMATYILFDVPANHLITASVMAAPCSLAMAKLSYPEVDKANDEMQEPLKIDIDKKQNVIEAAASGAISSIKVVTNISVNVISFVSVLAFVNATLKWFGSRVGFEPPYYPELTFQLCLSYLLMPLAFLMGVDKDDCRQLGELIGLKTFINEFVAYSKLGMIIENSKCFSLYNGTWSYIGVEKTDIFLVDLNRTLVGGVMQDRSIVISTYALCGFANISSIGMIIGVLGALIPEKKSIISKIAVRAMITGCASNFMNSCISGLLYQPK